jgi:hypothetical protein
MPQRWHGREVGSSGRVIAAQRGCFANDRRPAWCRAEEPKPMGSLSSGGRRSAGCARVRHASAASCSGACRDDAKRPGPGGTSTANGDRAVGVGRAVPQVDTVRTLADALRLAPVDLLDVDPDQDLTLQELRADVAAPGRSPTGLAVRADSRSRQRVRYSCLLRTVYASGISTRPEPEAGSRAQGGPHHGRTAAALRASCCGGAGSAGVAERHGWYLQPRRPDTRRRHSSP